MVYHKNKTMKTSIACVAGGIVFARVKVLAKPRRATALNESGRHFFGRLDPDPTSRSRYKETKNYCK